MLNMMNSRSELEMSLRNNTAMTPVSQVLHESCFKGKKKKIANIMLVFFLTVHVDWMNGSWVSVFEKSQHTPLKERSWPPLKSVTKTR